MTSKQEAAIHNIQAYAPYNVSLMEAEGKSNTEAIIFCPTSIIWISSIIKAHKDNKDRNFVKTSCKTSM